jgi:hypothetical protein
MIFSKNKRMFFLPSLAVAAFFTINKANAGTVKITNHSSNNIRINVVPEPSSRCLPYCWKCFQKCYSSTDQQTKEIVVPLNAFGGKEYFSVVGTEGGFLFEGECRNLSVFKNYEVSFYETFFNVRCEVKEIYGLEVIK